ncbi:MAG: molybdopterin molybdotransferase MoeA, partial [Vulcanimicrobiaceae bacterium]
MRNGFDIDELVVPEEAIRRFLHAVTFVEPSCEDVAIDDAFARVLGRSMHADRDYPDCARSAMDGFALAGSATAQSTWNLVGDVPMGGVLGRSLSPGTCARIPTGGVLPDGAVAVVAVEDTDESDRSVRVRVSVVAGDNVTPRGDDMHAGDLVLEAGRRLGPSDIGLLATLGVVAVPVIRRPIFGVLSSGDELVEPSSVPRPGQIRDSNRYAIAAALRAMGVEAVHLPSVPDHEGALAAALAEALPGVDGLILSGGSSVGERDRTPGAIAALGAPGVIVHGLRIKPGKPTVLAAIGNKPVIGLPGNPTSALMVLDAVISPILDVMLGATAVRRLRSVRLAQPLRG